MLALVRQEIGLHVRVREAIAVGSCQVPGPVNVHQQLPLSVAHTHQHLSSDLVVAFAHLSHTVETDLAAKTGTTLEWWGVGGGGREEEEEKRGREGRREEEEEGGNERREKWKGGGRGKGWRENGTERGTRDKRDSPAHAYKQAQPASIEAQ